MVASPLGFRRKHSTRASPDRVPSQVIVPGRCAGFSSLIFFKQLIHLGFRTRRVVDGCCIRSSIMVARQRVVGSTELNTFCTRTSWMGPVLLDESSWTAYVGIPRWCVDVVSPCEEVKFTFFRSGISSTRNYNLRKQLQFPERSWGSAVPKQSY